ncbi:helix-turn-helix transcriptional regulator [Rhizobium oryzihabitans]|uniref:helix-turn-helix transcriptional regulator n=1 Tax=Rhizobium oryzihabitans TaxID=2267833 RepID=UPI003CCD988B
MQKSKVDYDEIASRVSEVSLVADALEIVQSAYCIDFVTYHLASTIVGSFDAPFVRTTYPEAWVSRYLLNGYVRIDPVVREGFLRQLSFDWRELELTIEALPFLEDAMRHGVGPFGLSIPISDKAGRRAILSLNSRGTAHAWDQLVETYRGDWLDLAQLVHQKAVFELHGESDPVPAISARERECLYWSALGKDYKDIALILDISHHTARTYLKSARTKLGCATISAAATLALKLRLISI